MVESYVLLFEIAKCCPRDVMDSVGAFEALRGGSSPSGGTFEEIYDGPIAQW